MKPGQCPILWNLMVPAKFGEKGEIWISHERYKIYVNLSQLRLIQKVHYLWCRSSQVFQLHCHCCKHCRHCHNLLRRVLPCLMLIFGFARRPLRRCPFRHLQPACAFDFGIFSSGEWIQRLGNSWVVEASCPWLSRFPDYPTQKIQDDWVVPAAFGTNRPEALNATRCRRLRKLGRKMTDREDLQ